MFCKKKDTIKKTQKNKVASNHAFTSRKISILKWSPFKPALLGFNVSFLRVNTRSTAALGAAVAAISYRIKIFFSASFWKLVELICLESFDRRNFSKSLQYCLAKCYYLFYGEIKKFVRMSNEHTVTEYFGVKSLLASFQRERESLIFNR